MQPLKSMLLTTALLMLLLHCQEMTANETPEPAGSSLAKYVLAFSRPGAFKEIRAVFGEEPPITTSCPPGDQGLECRQDEARRVYDDCPGGDCEACIGCNRTNLWPRCCQQNAMCCSHLARACQICEPNDLHSFCAKHFKRCF
ncbi:hypothetical protein R5R35_006130 [Gryllus longicercus]|uniref:Uncharacterized protein n=1 Tax=Gryllus longicercus TaxID=2509291 RepID=A0AAN9Z2F1_9ORTH